MWCFGGRVSGRWAPAAISRKGGATIRTITEETGATIDGQRVTVTTDGATETFLLTTDTTVTTTDTIVLLLPLDQADAIADALANAMSAAFGGVLNSSSTANVVTVGEPVPALVDTEESSD